MRRPSSRSPTEVRTSPTNLTDIGDAIAFAAWAGYVAELRNIIPGLASLGQRRPDGSTLLLGGIAVARRRLAAHSTELDDTLPDDADILTAPSQNLRWKLTHTIYDAKFNTTIEQGTRVFRATMHSLADKGATAWNLQCPFAPNIALAPEHFRAMIRLELGLGPTMNADPRQTYAIINNTQANA